MNIMPEWAFLNGNFTAFADAALPLEDRGTQFGDGVYEVARIYRGHMFGFQEHVKRMWDGASIIGLEHDWTETKLKQVFSELIERNQQQDGIIYWQMTRGSAPRNHMFPKNTSVNFMAYTRDYPNLQKAWQDGVKVIVTRDLRWLMCHVKSVNLLANVLAKESASQQGAAEALFERDGLGVIEGGSSNLFIIKDGVLKTPPLTEHVLPGITRRFVLELAQAANIPIQEGYTSKTELLQSDEVFITSTGLEVMPVTTIDDTSIAGGAVGPITRQLQELYNAKVNAAAGGR